MTPAPATVSIPPRDFRKGPKQAPRESVQAPGASVTVTFLFGARIELRGVCGVSTDAVAQYVELLERGLAEQVRNARLAAPTLPAPPSDDTPCMQCFGGLCVHCAHRYVNEQPASIDSALIEECEQHPADCTDPCCVPDEHESLFFRDEADAVLSDSAAVYGVSSMGGW